MNRLGQPKSIAYTNKKTGQPDSFQKIGFQANEYPDRWFDFTFRGAHGLNVGESYEMETASREYNGKTYWDAKLPKKQFQPSGDLLRIERKIDAIIAMLNDMKSQPTDLDFPSYEEPS